MYRIDSRFRLDPARRRLECNDAPVPLAARAFDLLTALVERRGRPVSKEELTTLVWGETAATQNNLNQCVTALRKAFGDSPKASRFIATIPNVGYQFIAPVEEEVSGPQPAVAAFAAPAARPRWKWAAVVAAAAAGVLGLSYQWSVRGGGSAGAVARERRPFVSLRPNDEYVWLGRALGELNAIPEATGSYEIEGGSTLRVTLAGAPRAVAVTGPAADFVAVAAECARQFRRAMGRPEGARAPAPAALLARALAELRRGDWIAARASLRRAALADPRDARVLSALGGVTGEMGHLAESRWLHRRAAELAAELPPREREWIEARHASATADWPRAIDGLTRIWSRNPGNRDAAWELANVQFAARRTADAHATVTAALALLPGSSSSGGDARRLLLAARVQGQFANMEAARGLAARAAAAARGNRAHLLEARARLLEAGTLQNLQAPGFREARAAAKALCERAGEPACLAAAWRIEANELLSRGSLEQAAAGYGESLRQAQAAGNEVEQLQVTTGLASALLLNGRLEQAERVFREAMRIEQELGGPSSAALLNGLSASLGGQGRFPEAEEASRRAAGHAAAAADSEALAHSYLSLASARQGQAGADAGTHYQRACDLFRAVKNPEKTRAALIRFAQFQLGAGNAAAAERLLQEASELQTPLHAESLRQAGDRLARLRAASASP